MSRALRCVLHAGVVGFALIGCKAGSAADPPAPAPGAGSADPAAVGGGPPQATGAPGSPSATATIDGRHLPPAPPPFRGVIHVRASDSTPWWPPVTVPPRGAPNILLIMTDDAGYGVPSTFGGVIPTPTLDRLAKMGLRYTQFHSTALCSPTRAALITGRNHHVAGYGVVAEQATGYPGYDGIITRATGTIGQILEQNGYATAWFGKDHNTPSTAYSAAGPFDQWPAAMGFEYFYGFLGGETSQWTPLLFRNTEQIFPWRDHPGFNLVTGMADDAIAYLHRLNATAPDKPFFVYYVPGATHAPHQPTPEWIAKFKGKFDMGWNAVRRQIYENQKRLGVIPPDTPLTPWPSGQPEYDGASLPTWDSLTPDEKKLYARQAEVFAAYVAYDDHEIGRVVQAIADMGKLDNTLVIYISGDNGTSAEGSVNGTPFDLATLEGIPVPVKDQLAYYDAWGSPKTTPHMAAAWAWTFDAPFKWTKQIASHFGGTRQGMVIAWPDRIKDAGGIRTQFHHVIDIVPTILEVTGIPAPQTIDGIEQKPIDGVSMAYTFDRANANAPSRHTTQYFEMMGDRAIYHDGWLAATTPPRAPWALEHAPLPDVVDGYHWELYDVAHDYAEANDLAAKMPEKLHELQALFMEEAKKNQVLPLDNRFLERALAPKRGYDTGRTDFAYTGPIAGIPTPNAPDILGRSFAIQADVEVPPGGGSGVIVTDGGRFGGYGLYLLHGRPVFTYNLLAVAIDRWQGPEPLPPGRHTIGFAFTYDGPGIAKGGTGVLSVDGKEVARASIPHTIPVLLSIDETFDVGSDTRTPIDDRDYQVPFPFTGRIARVAFHLGPSQLEAPPSQEHASTP